MQCTDIAGFRKAVASCLPMKPGQGLGECPALAAAAQKYGAQCLDLTFFQGGPPIAAYACGKNAKVTAATQSVCNKLPNQQYHQTVVSGSGSGSGPGSGPDPGSGSSFGSDVWDSATSAGRFGAWGDDNEGWQSTTSTGAALGTGAQGLVAVLGAMGTRKFVRGVRRKIGKTHNSEDLGEPLGNQWLLSEFDVENAHLQTTKKLTAAQVQEQQQDGILGGAPQQGGVNQSQEIQGPPPHSDGHQEGHEAGHESGHTPVP